MITKSIADYLAFLLVEMRADAKVLDAPWVYCTVIPFCLYATYMGVKWYLLLAPITIPVTTCLAFWQAPKAKKLWNN